MSGAEYVSVYDTDEIWNDKWVKKVDFLLNQGYEIFRSYNLGDKALFILRKKESETK
jgi:hypothetical protein